MVIKYNPNVFFTVIGINGDEAAILCPFHQDSNPSASFNIKTGFFYCFTCQLGLNIKQLCYELNVKIEDAQARFEQKIVFTVIEKQQEPSKSFLDWYNAPLATSNWYMKFRGVSNSFIAKFKIKATEDAIVFPQFPLRSDVPYGVQLRNLKYEPKYKFVGKRTPVWPMQLLNNLDMDRPVYLTEGNFGALRALSAGLQAFSCQSAGGITKAIPLLMGFNVIVTFDNDQAGITGALKGIAVGWRASFPAFEADELLINEWWDFDRNIIDRTTSSFEKTLKKIDNKVTARKAYSYGLGHAYGH